MIKDELLLWGGDLFVFSLLGQSKRSSGELNDKRELFFYTDPHIFYHRIKKDGVRKDV